MRVSVGMHRTRSSLISDIVIEISQCICCRCVLKWEGEDTLIKDHEYT